MIHNQGGFPRYVGNYSFEEDHCVNFLLLYPGADETRHLSDIITDAYYGPQRDFEWDLLADGAPDSIPGTDATEEDGLEQGINQVFFATEDYPPLEWVQRIAAKYPTLEIILDYQREATELLGRVWFSEGRLYKHMHLTPFNAVDIMLHRENTNGVHRPPKPQRVRSKQGFLRLVKDELTPPVQLH